MNESLCRPFAAGIALWLVTDAAGFHPTLVGVILGLMAPARSWVSERRLRAIFSHVTERLPGKMWAADRAARRDLQQASVAARETLSPIERLEFALHPWVAYGIMPLFALANAGVSFGVVDLADRGAELVMLGVALALVVGKPLGIVSMTWIMLRLRLSQLPPGVTWSGTDSTSPSPA